MRSYATLGLERRRRRRRLLTGILLGLVLAGIYVLSVGAAYRAGVSQSAAEIERLLADLDDQRELGRKTSMLVASLEERLAGTRAQMQETRRVRAADLPPPVGPLAVIVERKLAAGVEARRIGEVLAPLSRERRCAPEVETRRLLLATPISRESGVSRFPGGFAITGKGVSVRDAQGRPEAWFDREQPVELALQGPGGITQALAGVLPLEQGVVMDGSEYLFRAEASPRRGFVELSLKVCDYP